MGIYCISRIFLYYTYIYTHTYTYSRLSGKVDGRILKNKIEREIVNIETQSGFIVESRAWLIYIVCGNNRKLNLEELENSFGICGC